MFAWLFAWQCIYSVYWISHAAVYWKKMCIMYTYINYRFNYGINNLHSKSIKVILQQIVLSLWAIQSQWIPLTALNAKLITFRNFGTITAALSCHNVFKFPANTFSKWFPWSTTQFDAWSCLNYNKSNNKQKYTCSCLHDSCIYDLITSHLIPLPNEPVIINLCCNATT